MTGHSTIPEIDYDNFSLSIHDKLINGRVPTDGALELTYRCNLKCRHCYCDRDAAGEEMALSDVLRILDEIAEAGCLWLLLTGGEPLTRPDFPEIYRYAVKKGFLVTLFTNGTLLTPEMADLINEYRPFSTEITLYGSAARTYEKVTGVAGSFERCMNGIALLRERGVPLKLKTMLMTLNRDDLAGMKELAASLGLSFKFDPIINPKLDGSKEPCGLRLSPEEIVALDLSDEGRNTEWNEFCDKHWHHSYSERLFTCGAGVTFFHIDPYARLKFCLMIKEPAYDLRAGSFMDGWMSAIPGVRSRRRTRDNRCKACDAGPICDQCAGWALLENGDMEEPVGFLCDIARLRAEAFGKTGKDKRGGRVHGKEALSEASR